jgi:hypothetical protein
MAQLDIVNVEEGMALGSISIVEDDEAADMAKKLRAIAINHGATAVAGVFPTAMLGESWLNACHAVMRGDFYGRSISLLASINDTRTPEGSKPTFRHVKFKEIGII